MNQVIYDFVIIGSGFGGSISAMRLAQKGYKVLLVEEGRRFEDHDFPKTNWNLSKYFWFPKIRFFGIQRIWFLKGLMVLGGSGVGGGSLVYANTLLRPKEDVLNNGFSFLKSPASEMNYYYGLAEKMLGVTLNPHLDQADNLIKEIASDLGLNESFSPTKVGIYFGKEVKDPYFSGQGPLRSGCILCGGCMIGCSHNSKNTLVKNYLYFFEKFSGEILAEYKADKIQKIGDIYSVKLQSTTKWFPLIKNIKTKKIVIAAGVLGTLKLLFKNSDQYKTLKNISKYLGVGIKTNGETLLGSTSFDQHRNLSSGIAIGSYFDLDQYCEIQPVRYPAGSSVMKFLAVPLTGDGGVLLRPLKMFFRCLIEWKQLLRVWLKADWAKNSIILLVMEKLDRQINVVFKRSLLFPFKKVLRSGATEKFPTYNPKAQMLAKKLSTKMNGYSQNIISEVLFGSTATAHILGGAKIGSDINSGVIDFNHQVFGYEGIYICDGSSIPCNLGVNPSLTIAAMAERFASQFPAIDEAKLKKNEIHFSSIL